MDYPKHIVAVSALIQDADGKILLARHPRRGWEFPGGQVEEGETLLQALQREIHEETGVRAVIGPLAGVYSNIKPPCKVIFGFLGRAEGGELRTSAESEAVGWVPREQVLARITHPAIRDRMQDLLEFSGRVIYRVYTTDPYLVHEQYYLK